jgi:hypothetical protein
MAEAYLFGKRPAADGVPDIAIVQERRRIRHTNKPPSSSGTPNATGNTRPDSITGFSCT